METTRRGFIGTGIAAAAAAAMPKSALAKIETGATAPPEDLGTHGEA